MINMNIAIIGGNNSGKSTLMVLLYAAQIRYSERSTGEFRFYLNPNSLRPISAEYNRLLMGKWPTDRMVERSPTISFLQSDQTDGAGSGLFSFFRKQKHIEPISLDFSLHDISQEEYENLKSSEKITFFNLDPKVESLLSSRFLTFMVDSSKLVVSKNMDSHISNILINTSRYIRKTVFPVFIFTKFDKMDKKLLAKLRLPRKPPAISNAELRGKYAGRLMGRFLPNTLNLIKSSKHINYNPGSLFYCSIRTAKNKEGVYSPALKKINEVKYILDCTYEELIGFIDYVENTIKELENS
jgi:hypothetical protein